MVLWAGAILVLTAAGNPAAAAPVADPVPSVLTREPDAAARPPPQAPVAVNLLPEDTTSVRVRVRRLAWNLSQHLKSLPGQGRFQTLAVLSFSEEGGETKKREIGKLVAAELASDLRRDHGLNLVERERIDAALNEGYLNELGLVDETKAVKLGQLLAAQALVVGDVSLAGNDFLINARIVSTSTGAVFGAEQEVLPAEGMVSFASEAVVLRTRSGAVFRSLVVPGWGQFYNRQQAKGVVFLSLTVALLGTSLGMQFAGTQLHGRYQATDDLALQERYLGTERDHYQARNALVGAAAAVWAYNIFDAFLNGKTFDPARGGD